ncbi:hypothetical protein LIER_35908 [Lithospermum erythrorhizon]|uniref:Uncharacterized protein n=1 Tax=Lithospermum erythrorhizon TaxID=34254 RepID=A0AAV3NZP1_LITER
MEALMELCDLIVENAVEFGEKLSWMCGRCPPPEIQLGRVTRSQLNAILAVSRFLSKSKASWMGVPNRFVSRFIGRFLLPSPPPFGPNHLPTIRSYRFIMTIWGMFKASDLSVDFAADVVFG